MNKLNPADCQSAFEELYKSSPVPIAVRSVCNTSINSNSKFVFKSPQPLCHNQLISPRPIVTSTSGPRLDPKSQLFESLKKPANDKSDDLVNDSEKEKTQAMTDGGEGDSSSVHDRLRKGKNKQVQPDTSSEVHQNEKTDDGSRSVRPENEEDDDEEDHFINNFFSKKSSIEVVAVADSNKEVDERDNADIEDGIEVSSHDDEPAPRTTRGQRQSRDQCTVEAPTKLYDWIVKPVIKSPSLRGLCLDGKRDKSVDEFWQTGIVTMRQSMTVVGTASGSRYHLIGPMDLYEAVEAGMSPEVAKKFKRGFPVNWVNVLQEFFSALDQEEGSNAAEDVPESQEVLKPSRPVSVSTFRKHDQYHLDSEDSETDIAQSDLKSKSKELEQPIRRNARACDSRNKYVSKTESSANSGGQSSSDDIFKPSKQIPDKKKATTKEAGSDQITKLHLWIIKPVQNSLGICLEGQRDREDEYWHSSVITQRMDQKRVVTNSGSVYQLVGPIQKLDALEAGIPEKIVKAFQNGFPKNWKTLLKKYYGETEGDSESDTSVTTATTATTSSSRQTRKKSEKAPQQRRKKRKEKLVQDETLDLDNTMCTPQGHLLDLDQVPRTRSGRRVMPQLAWWVGQRRTYDARGNVMEITYGTPAAESYVKQSYTDLKARSFRIGKSYTQNTSSVSNSRRTSEKVEKSVDIEKEVLNVIDKQKEERLSRPKENKETCYNETSRRRSKLDMIPVVPLTVMKGKQPSSLSETSDSEEVQQNRNNRGRRDKSCNSVSESSDVYHQNRRKQAKRKTSKRRIIEVTSSSEEDEVKIKPNPKSKRKPGRPKKTAVSKKRKSAESSSENEVAAKKARRKKITDSGDETSTSQTDNPSQKINSKKLTKGNKAKPTQEKKAERKEKCVWGKSEVKRMYKAIERTSEFHPHFWDVVAESVETRSPDECRIYHEDNSDQFKPQEKPKPKKKGKSKSKKGDTEDDFFQETPFRPQNNKKSKTFNLTADETVNFEDECIPTPGALHKTPIVRDIQTLRLEKSLLYKSKLDKQSAESSEETISKAVEKTKTKSDAKSNGIAGLTAGKGTMKRKEQLREIYEKHNEGEEDDIFDATPVRQKKNKKKVPTMFTLTEEEELEFESGCIPTPGSRHKTPIVRDSQISRFNKTPKSSAKTVTTPWLGNVNRKTTDQIIAQNQREGAKQRNGKVAKEGRTPKAGHSRKIGPTKSLFKSDATLSNLFEEVDTADQDEEEEKDYYWSDDE